MEPFPTVAAPGVRERADALAEAACHLHDVAGPGRWNRDAAEDAVEAIETAAHALATVDPRAELILAPLHTGLAELRRHLCLPPADPLTDTGQPPTPRTLGNPRRTRRAALPQTPAGAPTPRQRTSPARPAAELDMR
ncbi:hypothetical protein [Streptomyces sp. NPDC012888]|uniref:hypothetical protein n=1 Tax=Streptomyces sp. NPDC012888 TaxID=3364855 RepID=UPI00369C2138